MNAEVEMEPEFTKAIPSRVVCDFYYILFLIRITVGIIVLIFALYTYSLARKAASIQLWLLFFTQLGAVAIIVLDTLFNYLICERALKPGAEEKKGAQ